MSEYKDEKRREEEREEDRRSSTANEEQLSMLIGRLPSPSQSNDHGYRASGYSSHSATYDLVNNA
ncbi:MAG: hypothetical protein KF767_00745 [Bdellovibrionaceae bacterium]|nr:hypothetical protein [Pseudobdellovibrionaceae bacterium]